MQPPWPASGVKLSEGLTEEEGGWRYQGRCVTSYGELIPVYYGEHVCGQECDGPNGCLEARRETGRVQRVKYAKQLCSECEVRPECLEFALKTNEKFGIWGGMTERERRKERKVRGYG